jgi:cysteinyl-tRNA synthetase
MALKYLGDAFDIHGGGVELRFPHHENEQAQSRAAGHQFASYGMHNAWVTGAGQKMSKSLGNALSIPATLHRVRPIDLRFYIVASHYRSHVEFSFQALDDAAAAFARIENFLTRARRVLGAVPVGTWPKEFAAAMDNDLGTPAAVAVVHHVVREGNKHLTGGPSENLRDAAGAVRAMLGVLGADPLDGHWAASGSWAREERLSATVDALVTSLLESRARARAEEDFATADAIRDQLVAAGVTLEDTPHGPLWSLGRQ